MTGPFTAQPEMPGVAGGQIREEHFSMEQHRGAE